jgi:ribosomal protein L11 methyltransferase
MHQTQVLPEVTDCSAGPSRLFIYYLDHSPGDGVRLFDDTFIGNWEEDGSAFLFFSRPADGQVQALLASQPDLVLMDQYEMSYAQWHGDEISPYTVGRIHVHPPWITARNFPDEILTINLNPGVVFGTGFHPTTRHCLEAIQAAFELAPAPVRTVLDLGTGTGLLALAACGLGATRVLAVDLNFLAAHTAAANARRNGLQQRLLVVQGRAETFLSRPVDLLVANIHYDIMAQLLKIQEFATHGQVVLSGLLRSEIKAVRGELDRLGIDIVRTWDHEGIWFTLLGSGPR